MSNVVDLCARRNEKQVNWKYAQLVAAMFIERNVTDHAAFIDGDIDALENKNPKNYQHSDYYKGYYERVNLEAAAHRKGEQDFLLAHAKDTTTYDEAYEGDPNV